MYILRNLYEGMNNPYIPHSIKRDNINKIVEEENFTSLNNFLKYGQYEQCHNHVANKSIAQLLELSDGDVTVLANFIEIIRLNKYKFDETLTEESIDELDKLLVRLLVTLNNSPVSLPMYYDNINVDEDVFYYNLIKSLYKWIAIYMQYCRENGYKEIYVMNITNLEVFNGYLRNIQKKMERFITNTKIILASTDRYLEEDDVIITSKSELKEMIKDIMTGIVNGEENDSEDKDLETDENPNEEGINII